VRGRLALLLVASLAGCAALAGCTASKPSAKAGSCLAPLAATSAPPTTVAATGAGTATGTAPGTTTGSGAASGPALPTLALACLDGSGQASLAAVRRPMILSFWATWCPPCRAEVPTVESFAKSAAGLVGVVGVDSNDERGKATSFASDFKLTYPMMSDPKSALLAAAGVPGDLPTLMFVNAAGQIAYRYSSNKLDLPTLRNLTAKYLGVTVA
jgi:thiol-disulfide isomerase/thioredoxin